MDNETKKMFEQVLSKFDTMEGRFDKIEDRLDTMDKRFDKIENRLDTMEDRLDTMEIRQGEIYNIVQAIEHSNQVNKAELDNLGYRTAHIEGTINGVSEVLDKHRAV